MMDTQPGLIMTFNRALTDAELEAYQTLPPAPQMAEDMRFYASRMIVAELVARLFEFYILGSIVLPDTPAAMDWLRSYMKGHGHGPLGQPIRWPLVASAVNLLDRWGFCSLNGYVAKRP
jgi:alkanesulfonate monooxygenase SsuD/methylene tetrahydromethanopterin reductase-like flavin-dependent oxidoreductase (luciferase family)